MSDEEDTESEIGKEEDEEEEDDEEEDEEEEVEEVVKAPTVVQGKQKEEQEKEEEEEEDDEAEENILNSLNLGQNCIRLLRNAFIAFDHERRGVLGTEMIGVILELLGHSLVPIELDQIIREVDADGSGELEFVEFVILASKFLPEDNEEESPEQLKAQLKEAFRFYDKEGNGYITTGDFKNLLSELDPEIPEAELQGMVDEIDLDGSGTVDFDEFITALS